MSIERKCSQPIMVEQSEWFTDLTSVRNQLFAKRSYEPMGATEARKLIHKHQTKARNYVTEDNSQDFKTKSTDQVWCFNKWIHELWNYPDFRITNAKQKKRCR